MKRERPNTAAARETAAARRYEAVSSRPLVIAEFGVDAFDMVSRAENEEMQSEWVRSLALELDANAVSCTDGCLSRVVSGGMVMSWVDEWYKGSTLAHACYEGGGTPGLPRCRWWWSTPANQVGELWRVGGQPAIGCTEAGNRARCISFWRDELGFKDSCPDYDANFLWNNDARLCHYDALVIGFVNYWTAQPSCKGPIEPPLDGMPQLLTNACIQKGPAWLGKPAEWAGCGLINCGGCGEGTVGDAVLDYQKRGKRVIISVGGQNADATNMDPDKGRALADAIWNLYLGGGGVTDGSGDVTASKYAGWRPFGPNVVLDGVDIDLEQTPRACSSDPSSAACLSVQEGWYEFTRRIRALMDADPRKEYLITAVPINTKFGDPKAGSYPSWGAYTHGYLPGIDNCPADFAECNEMCPVEGVPHKMNAPTVRSQEDPADSMCVTFNIEAPASGPAPTHYWLYREWENDRVLGGSHKTAGWTVCGLKAGESYAVQVQARNEDCGKSEFEIQQGECDGSNRQWCRASRNDAAPGISLPSPAPALARVLRVCTARACCLL